MKTLKIKSKSLVRITHEIYEKISEGWAVTKEPKQNWFGKWVCKMKKD